MNVAFETLLRDIATTLGIDAAELVRTQEITVDDHTIGLHCEGEGEATQCIFFTTVAPLYDAQFTRLARTLLEANYLWAGTNDCTLAIQPVTGNLALCVQVAVAALDGGRAAAVLDTFVDTAQFWRAVVEDAGESLLLQSSPVRVMTV